jgi:hypothetical protein
MTTKPIPRPRDPIALAKLIGDIATGEVQDTVDDGKDAAAANLGRTGGLKGGAARAKALDSQQRSAIASKAAQSRWAKKTTQ